MKKNKFIIPIHIILSVCAVFGWWGLLYPEFTMTPSTYNVVYEDNAAQEQEEWEGWDFDDETYWEILDEDCSRIRFRSRFLDYFIFFRE
ncbi:MAG: hypothetical protein E7291_05340 [Lachnospiraceae bacterium]|nr:hypothetical protein [Lachnospiraceae bacterium]